MVTIVVPDSHPLTSEGQGTEVFVVQDLEGNTLGAYPSHERVFKYAEEWVKAGDPNAIMFIGAPDKNGESVVCVDYLPSYKVQRTSFRF